jgi:hypothetical protein
MPKEQAKTRLPTEDELVARARNRDEAAVKETLAVPVNLSAHVRDTIEGLNADFVAHTATARNGAFDIMPRPTRPKASC